MPELPEVETIRRQLQPLIVGKTISSIEVFLKKSFIGGTKDLIGKKIEKIERKGKVLILKLQDTSDKLQNTNIYIHLRMSGQVLFINHKSYVINHRHLRVAIHFTGHSQLQFIDQRTFGFITTNQNIVPRGIDALDPALTADKLSTILKSANRPIKQILLDQNLIAGIGNIYASEILWESRINPATKGLSFRAGNLTRLHSAIRKILTEAIKHGGSTMSDQLYRQVRGEAGGYQKHFRVYDREGKPCQRCQTLIKKIKMGQRGTYFCPGCQG